MRDLKKFKQIHHCNIIPLDLPKWVFLDQTETVFDEKKTIWQWKRCSKCNGIDPTSHKYTKTPELETFSKFQQHWFQILIKTESGSS